MDTRINNQLQEEIIIGSINLNGISNRNHILLDNYVYKNKIKILAVQESLSCDLEKIKLSNMKTITDSNKATNRGALLYIHDTIPSTNLQNISKLSKKIDSAWALVVIDSKRYIVGSVYVNDNHPNSIEDTLLMINTAEEMKTTLKAVGVIAMGDYNARHTLWGDRVIDDHGRKLAEKINYSSFSILTSPTPTFLCAGGSSFIDLVVASNNIVGKLKDCCTDETVELWSGAPRRGHVPLLTALKGCAAKPNRVVEKLDIDAMNWEDWTNELEKQISDNLEELFEVGDPDTLWEFLEKAICESSVKHGTMKRSSIHSRPYWTKELSLLCEKMKEARKFYMRRNTDRNKELMIEAKEIFDNERKKACQEFIIEATKSLNAAESAEFWKKFNAMFKKTADKGIDPLIDENLKVITENSEIEEKLFETFFQSKHLHDADLDENFYEELVKEYEDIKNRNMEDEDTQVAPQNIINAPITIKEIKEAIKKTKTSKKGLDNHNMHPKMLHSFGINALKLLEKLFNECLNKSKWVWDLAKVVFLKKEGKESYSQAGSYRPISISSYIGKLLEKILAKRIVCYLEAIGVFDSNQEGFTTKRNTIRYLNRLDLKIKYERMDGNTVIGLFIDFEKAFDSIWKKGLIVKMFKLKIQGKILKLIDEFLDNRKVKLDVNGDVGQVRNTSTYGLPQGSALSPVLFKLYLLDILEEFNGRSDISILKFADDGSVIISQKTSEKCIQSLEQVMESLKHWSSRWRMKINCQKNKTEFICFGTAENNADQIPLTIKLGHEDIRKVEETKVLGVMVDSKLSYLAHSQMILKRLLGKWATICKYSNNRWGFSQKVITQISRTLILTIMHYAGLVWINSKNMEEIEQLWYRIVKAATGAVFNLRKSIAEVINGIPPINIQNRVNKIKHYLKLNINPSPEDKVREFIETCYSQQLRKKIPPELIYSLKESFRFLSWKSEMCPNQFTENDKTIIVNKSMHEYLHLTTKACSYTKNLISKYTEKIWYSSIKNELNMDGLYYIPKPSCAMLPVPANTTREQEVVLMSLMYSNNLFNSFLYRHTYLVESPLCRRCKQQEETPYHIILECSDKSEEAKKILCQVVNEEEIQINDCTTLLNGSRHPPFIKICLEILKQDTYRVQVAL